MKPPPEPWLPDGPGVVTTVFMSSPGSFMVAHEPSHLCSIAAPHESRECREFEPVRPGFEPEPDPPITRPPLRQMTSADWARYFTTNEIAKRGGFRIPKDAPEITPLPH